MGIPWSRRQGTGPRHPLVAFSSGPWDSGSSAGQQSKLRNRRNAPYSAVHQGRREGSCAFREPAAGPGRARAGRWQEGARLQLAVRVFVHEGLAHGRDGGGHAGPLLASAAQQVVGATSAHDRQAGGSGPAVTCRVCQSASSSLLVADARRSPSWESKQAYAIPGMLYWHEIRGTCPNSHNGGAFCRGGSREYMRACGDGLAIKARHALGMQHALLAAF